MKRISVSEAISKVTVASLFARKYMYLPYRCPTCKFEEKYMTYRWHFLEGSWVCKKCEQTPHELQKRVQSNVIEVVYRCVKCGNEWTTKIRFYP